MPEVTGAWPAATVILLRDTSEGPETLLLHRNTAADFAGGMAVFPGGRVEDDDWTGVVDGDDLGAARNAAARETHEEAGLVIDAGALVAFSHWQPPPQVPKRFLTWFFVGSAPDTVVAVDGGEIVDHLWVRPSDALAQHARGDLQLMPPTWVTLMQVAHHDSAGAVVDAAVSTAPESFQAHFVPTDAGIVLLYEGDVSYNVHPPDIEMPGPRRRLDTRQLPWEWHEG